MDTYPNEPHLPAPQEGCPDGGTCHHDCGVLGYCWRVLNCAPLSGVYDDDKWPKALVNEHAEYSGAFDHWDDA